MSQICDSAITDITQPYEESPPTHGLHTDFLLTHNSIFRLPKKKITHGCQGEDAFIKNSGSVIKRNSITESSTASAKSSDHFKDDEKKKREMVFAINYVIEFLININHTTTLCKKKKNILFYINQVNMLCVWASLE